MKRLLITVGSLLAVVVLAAGITGYLYYDKATKPDLSSPGVVVRQYLLATFDPGGRHQASEFTCANSSLAEIDALSATIRSREQDTGQPFTVGWDRFTTVQSGDSAVVSVTLTIATREDNGSDSEDKQNWKFDVVQQSGWRVCGAHEDLSLQPK